MNRTLKTVSCFSIATVLGGAGLFWSDGVRTDRQSSLISSAEARIGRPLTPMSYAGVARRTTRRAVAVGVGAGAVAYGATVYGAPPPPAAYPPACYQAVDPYGRVYTRCP
jgi:hypothetical protein